MKTSDLINALVEDQAVNEPLFGPTLVVWLAMGLAVSVAIFAAFLGVRADIANAIIDPHVQFKFIFAASLFVPLLALTVYGLWPERELVPMLRWLALPMVVLVSGMAFQLLTSPSDYWVSGMVGRYPSACLRSIPALAIGPLLAILAMLRNGAPAQPVVSGAIAGAGSGGLAAFIYALHCPDDSALFVALWYSLAIGIVSVIGGLLGRYWLKW
jgi:hypothetical protein